MQPLYFVLGCQAFLLFDVVLDGAKAGSGIGLSAFLISEKTSNQKLRRSHECNPQILYGSLVC